MRRLWLKLHRWLGLSLGLLLLVSGITGTLLLVAEPLEEAMKPHLYQARAAGDGRLDPALANLRQEFGPDAAFTMRPPREASETLHVFVTGPWSGTVFLDPASGEELGRLGQKEGVFNTLFGLHSTLLASDAGRAVLAVSALTYVLLLLTGLLLWWPKLWRHALKVKTSHGLTRALFDLHRVGGAVLGMVVLVSVITGAYMAWRPISLGVSMVAGSQPVLPPKLSEPTPAIDRVDLAVERAKALVPDARVGYVQVPKQGADPVRIRLRMQDDPHPNGLTSVWLHPTSVEVLAVHRWTALDLGTRAYAWIYPLHIGDLAGRSTWTLTLVSGLALSLMGMSGLWLWWRRRQRIR